MSELKKRESCFYNIIQNLSDTDIELVADYVHTISESDAIINAVMRVCESVIAHHYKISESDVNAMLIDNLTREV